MATENIEEVIETTETTNNIEATDDNLETEELTEEEIEMAKEAERKQEMVKNATIAASTAGIVFLGFKAKELWKKHKEKKQQAEQNGTSTTPVPAKPNFIVRGLNNCGFYTLDQIKAAENAKKQQEVTEEKKDVEAKEAEKSETTEEAKDNSDNKKATKKK